MVRISHESIRGGGVERLNRELDQNRATLERAYVRALGSQNAQKVLDVAERILPRQAFLDTIEEFDVYTGSVSSSDRLNTFSILSAGSLDDTNWKPVQPTTITMAPLFYTSEQGFRRASSDRDPETILSSYVHNWNKFVWFAVQEPPMYTLVLGEHRTPETFIPYIAALDKSDLPIGEIQRRLGRAALTGVVSEVHDCVIQLLDLVVLDNIGVRVNLDWRKKPRGVIAIGPTPKRQMEFMLPSGGDPFFAGGTNEEIIQKFASDWSTFIVPKGFASDPAKDEAKALLDSVAHNVTINKVSITEFHLSLEMLGSAPPQTGEHMSRQVRRQLEREQRKKDRSGRDF